MRIPLINRTPTPKVERLPIMWKAVVIALVKAQGLHEGIWKVDLDFGQPIPSTVNTHDNTQQFPGAVLLSRGVVLQRTDALSGVSVDAAVCNPRETIQ